MEELASAGGVALRTLYRLFGSRQVILREAGCAPEPTARQRILEAGLELVGRSGLAELSMDELAEAAGVSRATLYRLFPGKSALFSGLIEAYSPWEAVLTVIEAMPDGPPDEVMPAVGRAIAETMEGRTGLLLRMVFELIKGEPDTTEGMRRGVARGLPDLVAYLSRQVENGRLRPVHPILALQLLAGPILAHLLTRPLAEAVTDFRTPVDEAVGEIVEAWLRAMATERGSDG